MKTITLIIEGVQKQFLDMENKVLLLDDLGKKYGETHVYYNLKTPAEAIKLLCINYPELVQDLATSHEQGIFYKVQQVGIDLELSDLSLPLGSNDLVVTPVISGSGNTGKFLLGAALIGVGIFSGGAGFGVGGGLGFGSTATNAAGALTGAFSAAAVAGNVGIFLVLNGVSGLLTPQPVLPNPDFDGSMTNFTGGPASLEKGADGKQSYAYTGATNSTGLGKTIPVAYGKVLAGSLLIGAKIKTDTTSDPNINFFREPGIQTFNLNGTKYEKLEGKFADAGGITALTRKGKKGKNKIAVKSGQKYYQKIGKTVNLQFKKGEQFLTTGVTNPQGGTGTIAANSSKKGKRSANRFGIAFKIKGLIDQLADKQTAFIDGFITYQVIIKASGSNNIVGQHQMTIQGLFKAGQSVLYIVQTPFHTFGTVTKYRVAIKIIDFSVLEEQCAFTVQEIGMGLK